MWSSIVLENVLKMKWKETEQKKTIGLVAQVYKKTGQWFKIARNWIKNKRFQIEIFNTISEEKRKIHFQSAFFQCDCNSWSLNNPKW